MYLVHMVERCAPTIRLFKRKKDMLTFFDKFKTSHDDWIDFIVKNVKAEKNLYIVDQYRIIKHPPESK